jgi:hypothetical protein
MSLSEYIETANRIFVDPIIGAMSIYGLEDKEIAKILRIASNLLDEPKHKEMVTNLFIKKLQEEGDK